MTPELLEFLQSGRGDAALFYKEKYDEKRRRATVVENERKVLQAKVLSFEEQSIRSSNEITNLKSALSDLKLEHDQKCAKMVGLIETHKRELAALVESQKREIAVQQKKHKIKLDQKRSQSVADIEDWQATSRDVQKLIK